MSIDMKEPLNPKSAEGRELLKDLQGNILKGHGRYHAMHLFICFGTPSDKESHVKQLAGARHWIADMVSSRVTSAAAQRDDPNKQEVFGMLLLSSQGYEFLRERRPRDGGFREGMRERRNQLNDPRVEHWSPKYQMDKKKIHALVIVASSKKEASDAVPELDEIKAVIENELVVFGGSILVDERGRQELNKEGRAIEHFGYRDGVSQPQFIDEGRAKAKKYDQRAALKLVLEKDRHGDGGYGSFFVYRLLEQNVGTFNAAVASVAKQLGEEPDLVGAMAVGRFKNGTPLTKSGASKQGYKANADEDFNYDHDDDGNRCPFHSHIRKVNPRGSLGRVINFVIAREQNRRIARRAITYTDTENNTVGLIFMCFQSDIKDQFEFIQRRWANSRNFSERGTGLDPVIGQDGGSHENNNFPNWPKGYKSEERERIQFGEHVTLRGGEYFFAPSISGLKELGNA